MVQLPLHSATAYVSRRPSAILKVSGARRVRRGGPRLDCQRGFPRINSCLSMRRSVVRAKPKPCCRSSPEEVKGSCTTDFAASPQTVYDEVIEFLDLPQRHRRDSPHQRHKRARVAPREELPSPSRTPFCAQAYRILKHNWGRAKMAPPSRQSDRQLATRSRNGRGACHRVPGRVGETFHDEGNLLSRLLNRDLATGIRARSRGAGRLRTRTSEPVLQAAAVARRFGPCLAEIAAGAARAPASTNLLGGVLARPGIPSRRQLRHQACCGLSDPAHTRSSAGRPLRGPSVRWNRWRFSPDGETGGGGVGSRVRAVDAYPQGSRPGTGRGPGRQR